MRLNIKRALYNDMLGDPNRTPATATEIAERMADLSRNWFCIWAFASRNGATSIAKSCIYSA